MAGRLLLLICAGLGSVQTVLGEGRKSENAIAALVSRRASDPRSVVVAEHPDLRASLQRMERSQLWRDAVAEATPLGRVAILLTPDELPAFDAADPAPGRSFDGHVLGEVFPVTRDGLHVDHVVVVVNAPLLRAGHDRRGSLPGEFQADLDRVVAHEVYGHAVPYLVGGTLAARCSDPQPGQRAVEACAIRRENSIRAELALGRRVDAGLVGLFVAWNTRR